MSSFLGDDEEEKARKAELKSILSGAFYGWIFGGLAGLVLNGYKGFLAGMLIGPPMLSFIFIQRVKSERRKKKTKQLSQKEKPEPQLSVKIRRS